jgi:2-polyprenyl-6-hydroxyphenyl methylase/3-demethylubiquinone-9 3-methyltransferase
MDRWHDFLDWVGGYPFEVATPEQVFEFCAARGFELRKLATAGGSHGCNEFVFELPPGSTDPD